MVPSLGVCRIALSSRLRITRPNSSGSTWTGSVGQRLADQPDALRPGDRVGAGQRLLDQVAGRDPLQVQPHRALDAGQLEQVGHHLGEPVDLDAELPVVAADSLRVGDDAVLQRLDHGPHAGQRGPQVVAHAGDQLTSAASVARRRRGPDQSGMGAVERGRHGAQLAGRHLRGPVEGRVTHLHRRIGQGAAGAAQRSAEQQRDPDPGHRSQPADHEHHPRVVRGQEHLPGGDQDGADDGGQRRAAHDEQVAARPSDPAAVAAATSRSQRDDRAAGGEQRDDADVRGRITSTPAPGSGSPTPTP